MATAVTCSTVGVRCFVSNRRRLAASSRSIRSISAASSEKEPPSSPKKRNNKGKSISQKKYHGRSKEERPYPFVDGDSCKGDTGISDSRSFGSFGMQKTDKRALLYDLKEQQSLTPQTMESRNGKPNTDHGGAMVADQQLPFKQMPRDLAARFLALLLTLAATIVVGINKETKTISVQIADGLPSLHLPVTAKWQYMSAFVYFVVCNAIACTYAAASLAHGTAHALSKNAALAMHILDTVMVGLLFSANGASAAIGDIAWHGNSHVRWDKVCTVFDNYCCRMEAALILSLLGSLAFLWQAVVNVVNLQKRTR